MGLMTPAAPEFDLEDWAKSPYQGRLRLMCQAWAMQGFGAPGVVYLFYVAKLVLYVGGFLLFAATTPGLGGLGSIGGWWSSPSSSRRRWCGRCCTRASASGVVAVR